MVIAGNRQPATGDRQPAMSAAHVACCLLPVACCLLAVIACGSPAAPAQIQPIPPPLDAQLVDAMLPSSSPLVQLALGGAHSCALHADGTVSSWGSNAHLELGVTDAGDIAHAIRVPGVAHATQLAAGDGRTCILRDGGQVACWGALDNTSSETPMELPLPPVAQIAGDCLRTRDGAVMCWPPRGGPPAQIAGVADARDVASFYSLGCAVVGDDGRVACWGRDDGRWDDALTAARPIDGVTGATRVAVGADFACALLHDGHVSCWGCRVPGPRSAAASCSRTSRR